MNNQFLADLQVTAEELSELQSNERPFGLLTERQREILNVGRTPGATQLYAPTDEWDCVGNYPKDSCSISATYRLHPDLTLPELSQRPSDPREPFRWTIDGHNLWCCPVYEYSNRRMYFKDPYEWVSTLIGSASSVIGFCGVASADDDGVPCDFRADVEIGLMLCWHHRGEYNLDFVCFRVKEVGGE
jgi:hypothetical protein